MKVGLEIDGCKICQANIGPKVSACIKPIDQNESIDSDEVPVMAAWLVYRLMM